MTLPQESFPKLKKKRQKKEIEEPYHAIGHYLPVWNYICKEYLLTWENAYMRYWMKIVGCQIIYDLNLIIEPKKLNVTECFKWLC